MSAGRAVTSGANYEEARGAESRAEFVHNVKEVLPEVPVRHWVCSFPWGVRRVFRYDRELCREAASAFAQELRRSLKRRAKTPHTGSRPDPLRSDAQGCCSDSSRCRSGELWRGRHWVGWRPMCALCSHERPLRSKPPPSPCCRAPIAFGRSACVLEFAP